MNRIIVTGGAGFIGSAVVDYILKNTRDYVLVIDKLTYAGNIDNLQEACKNSRFYFHLSDICDTEMNRRIFTEFAPTHIFHLAAESHVDRSISKPSDFIKSNIQGTYSLLENSLEYFRSLAFLKARKFRFLHVSTDEVYGDSTNLPPVRENSPYNPSSPYSASKAASDHLVNAYCKTYSLHAITVHCSNNYGPRQFPEKLIPLTIKNALENKSIPIYGDGMQERDWLYVKDSAEALYLAGTGGRVGEVYNIGGNDLKKNIDTVKLICSMLDGFQPRSDGRSYAEQISYVADRPAHDRCYSLDCTKFQTEFDWRRKTEFADGIAETVKYYLEKYNIQQLQEVKK